MGISEIVTSLAGSVLGGGATGLLGAVVSRVGDYYLAKQEIEKLKLKYDNEIELRHADARIMELEWQGRDKVAVSEGLAAVDVADSNAFNTSLTNEPKLYSNPSKLSKAVNGFLGFVDGVRGLIRPLLTVFLCAIMASVYVGAGNIIKDKDISPEQAFEIYMQISTNILYLTTCCVLWWFGTRPSKNSIKNIK